MTETTGGNMASRRSCAAVTAGGRPCRGIPLDNNVYCLFHSQDAEHKKLLADSRRAGGLASLASLRPIELEIRLGSAEECRATATAALQLLIGGKLDRGRCDSIVSGCTRMIAVLARQALEKRIDEVERLLREVADDDDGQG